MHKRIRAKLMWLETLLPNADTITLHNQTYKSTGYPTMIQLGKRNAAITSGAETPFSNSRGEWTPNERRGWLHSLTVGLTMTVYSCFWWRRWAKSSAFQIGFANSIRGFPSLAPQKDKTLEINWSQKVQTLPHCLYDDHFSTLIEGYYQSAKCSM